MVTTTKILTTATIDEIEIPTNIKIIAIREEVEVAVVGTVMDQPAITSVNTPPPDLGR